MEHTTGNPEFDQLLAKSKGQYQNTKKLLLTAERIVAIVARANPAYSPSARVARGALRRRFIDGHVALVGQPSRRLAAAAIKRFCPHASRCKFVERLKFPAGPPAPRLHSRPYSRPRAAPRAVAPSI